MTETPVQFRKEGDLAFPIEAETDPSAASPAEETALEGGTEAPAAAKPLPFNEDPAVQEYLGRQLKKQAEELEQKFTGSIATIREEFGQKRDDNAAAKQIPPWFGGDQAQWDEYRKWFDGQLSAAETRAINGTIEKARESTSAEKKAVDDATDYLKTELAAITADKALNPTGKAIDPNKLLKTVMDNDLVDSKGRWNYRAGMRLLNSHPTASHANSKDGKEKKDLAAATIEGAGAQDGAAGKPKAFKTPADFKKRRPW